MCTGEAPSRLQRFRGGLVFKAHRLLYHSTLGLSGARLREEPGDVYRGGAVSPECVFV